MTLSSSITSRDRLFTAAFALSMINQATPSASVSKRQWAAALAAEVASLMNQLRQCLLVIYVRASGARTDVEIADQRTVIGKPHVRHVQMSDFDAVGIQHEIQLF